MEKRYTEKELIIFMILFKKLKKNKKELARIATKEMERPLKKPNLKQRNVHG